MSNVQAIRPTGKTVAEVSPDYSIANGGGGGDSGDMEERVERLERGVGRIETALAVMSEKLSHLATKAELTEQLGDVKEVLASKPSTGAMWLMAIALFGLVIAAIALGPVIIPLLQGHH